VADIGSQQRVREIPDDVVEERLGFQVPDLAYVVALLRHFRPEFDRLPHGEQIALVERACTYVNKFVDALRKLMAFLEYGRPWGLPNKIRENVEWDVWAAVLKDVYGLSYTEIGEQFKKAPTLHDEIKGGHKTASNMVKRGRKILEQALGKEGWRKQAEAMRAVNARWDSMSKEARQSEA
jgi:hypothetical protein